MIGSLYEQLNIEDRSYAVRVSVFPTVSGVRIALRLSSTHSAIMDLDNIGMPEIILLDYGFQLARAGRISLMEMLRVVSD